MFPCSPRFLCEPGRPPSRTANGGKSVRGTRHASEARAKTGELPTLGLSLGREQEREAPRNLCNYVLKS